MSIDSSAMWAEIDDGITIVRVTLIEALGYNQSYETFGGFSSLRLQNGTAVKQVNWEKIRTTLSGNGRLPMGLNGLNYSSALTLKCGAPRGIQSVSNVIAYPAEHRIDGEYLPQARKFVGDTWQVCEVSLTATQATCTLDAAASRYLLLYWPQIIVMAQPPSESFAWGGAETTWSLTAEQM